MKTTEALKTYKLRNTDAREAVLGVFHDENFAISHSYIETQLADRYDRVTLYRTIKIFLEKGLIHKVLDDQGGMKYALCKAACNTPNHIHNHDHVHFKCQVCSQTICLDNIIIPTVALPAGFVNYETNLLMQGVCNKCQIVKN
jgi:Fur family transcriptional regulator, ferric uptake regulator